MATGNDVSTSMLRHRAQPLAITRWETRNSLKVIQYEDYSTWLNPEEVFQFTLYFKGQVDVRLILILPGFR